MMASKFTFKKMRVQTGLAGTGHPYPDTLIKLEKQIVGRIFGPNWMSKDHLWGIALKKILNSEGEWEYITLKKRCESEPEARKFLNDNFQKVVDIGLRASNDDGEDDDY